MALALAEAGADIIGVSASLAAGSEVEKEIRRRDGIRGVWGGPDGSGVGVCVDRGSAGFGKAGGYPGQQCRDDPSATGSRAFG